MGGRLDSAPINRVRDAVVFERAVESPQGHEALAIAV
jgi:hypothetical protein